MEYKIEEVSQFKGDTLRVDFDCREPLFINSAVAYDLGLRVGAVFDDDELENAVKKNIYRRARERALYLLDVRDYGYAEMFKKLSPNYPEEICYDVVNNLAEIGLIDDRRYAKKCAEYYLLTKQRGEFSACEEMRKRGIPNEIIDETLEEYQDGAVDRLRDLISRKYLKKLSEEGGAGKVRAALMRQGYSYSDINEVLSEDREEW